MQLEVLRAMEAYGQAVMYLGLIFDIIILLFVILSILLIYSLLSISVETKTFEFGVMRMVGLSKTGIINMIVLQGFMFVLPSLICGFVLAVPALNKVYELIFEEEAKDQNSMPSAFAVYQALLMGAVIPLFSSITPIQNALSKDLNDSLDISRSKTKAVFVEILDNRKQNMGSYIVFGLIAVVYGLSIYYFLPKAMLSFNFALVL
jgi:ABC-type lipoprotein release transport system permease subunit